MAGEWRASSYGPFSIDFSEDRLEDLCSATDGIQTGPFGSQLHQRDYVGHGTPIVTVKHLVDNRITHQDLPLVSDYDKRRLAKYTLNAGDIVFSRVGSVDRRAYVTDSENGWLFSGRCLRVRVDPVKIDSRFLSYFFGLPTFQEHVRSIAVGATMPSLNTQILSNVEIYYPPLPEQRAIAHILGTLDDKIELNRRMNKTLEAMARALFKSWFVDFDPVRAKMEGRDTGLPPEIAALFPDRLVLSDLGEIPDGWDVKPVGEVLEITGGGTPSTKEPEYWTNGSHAFCTPKDMAQLDSPALLFTERMITDAGVEKISSGQLPSGTLLMSSRAPIGYLAISDIPVSVNQGIIAIPPGQSVPVSYLQHWAGINLNMIKAYASGSTFLEISKRNFKLVSLLVPGAAVLSKFDHIAGALHDRMVINMKQSQELTSLRDSLLPKLMSGELRVHDD